MTDNLRTVQPGRHLPAASRPQVTPSINVAGLYAGMYKMEPIVITEDRIRRQWLSSTVIRTGIDIIGHPLFSLPQTWILDDKHIRAKGFRFIGLTGMG